MDNKEIKKIVMDVLESEKLYSLSSMEFMEGMLKEKYISSSFWRLRKFEMLEYKIRVLLENKLVPSILSEHLRKIELLKTVFYWFEHNETMTVGAEFYKSDNGLITIQIQQNNWSNYTLEDFYIQVLKNCKIKIFSIDLMEDADFKAWKKLFLIYKVSVSEDGKNLLPLTKVEELDNYYDSKFQKFRYVLEN
jgi:hypothetical protein